MIKGAWLDFSPQRKSRLESQFSQVFWKKLTWSGKTQGEKNQNRCPDKTEIVMIVNTMWVTLANAVLKNILIQFLLCNLFYLHFFFMDILLTTFSISRNQNTLQIAIHIQKWDRLHFNHWSDENFIRNRAFFG